MNRTKKIHTLNLINKFATLTIPPGRNFHNKRNTEALPGMTTLRNYFKFLLFYN